MRSVCSSTVSNSLSSGSRGVTNTEVGYSRKYALRYPEGTIIIVGVVCDCDFQSESCDSEWLTNPRLERYRAVLIRNVPEALSRASTSRNSSHWSHTRCSITPCSDNSTGSSVEEPTSRTTTSTLSFDSKPSEELR